MVKRYWRVAVIGLGVGFFLGAALFGMMAVSGNPDWRGYLAVEDVLRSTVSYGLIGLLVAAAAVVGGWASVALFDRRFERRPSMRVSLAAVGAAAGTMLLGSLAGIVDSVQGSASWLVVIVGIAFVLAVVAAIAAAVLVSHAERHPPSSSVKAVSQAPDGHWIDF
ncbi:hypothetical protein E3T25_04745 [Cryobacterium sandaracinum]|uniref:Major facilitator superfamily (MFS) profile domain-containing protein n=1 Tax=Cryobacterium sandaracinum TaxID=1259247 RepID=A0ABY2JFR0_9MICO|nr:hypothetical protein [Cryobacterium sandaracinum]TFD04827.1 hypothetical protein E3T25_04745 [Cryobacterium sandaracinum]